MKIKLIQTFFFGGKARASLYKKLSAYTQNSVKITDAIVSLNHKYEDMGSPLNQIMEIILERFEAGQSFSQAISEFIPAEESLLIKAAELDGRLHIGLQMSCDLIKNKNKIKSSLIGAITYPAVLGMLFCVIMLVVSLKVLPQIAMVLPAEKWTGMLGVLHIVSSFITSVKGFITLFLLVLLFVATILSFSKMTGRIRVFLDKLPPWSIYRLVIGSSWLFTFSTMLNAGMKTTDILGQMIKNSEDNRWLVERIQAIKDSMTSGMSTGEAMVSTGFDFPDKEIVYDLEVYSTMPNFGRNLQELAKDWITEGIEKIEAQAAVINVVFILFIMVLVGCVLMSISSLQQQITQNMG